jgi:hypothetical protein
MVFLLLMVGMCSISNAFIFKINNGRHGRRSKSHFFFLFASMTSIKPRSCGSLNDACGMSV